MARTVFILGSSYTQALRRAFAARPPGGTDFDINWLQQGGKHGDVRTLGAVRKLRRLAPDDLAVFCFWGAAHYHYGTFGAGNKFRIIGLGSHPHADEPPIAASLMLHALKEPMKTNRRLELFLRNARCPAVHIASPPTIADTARMENRLRHKTDGRNQIRPAQTRLQVWQLEMMAIRAVCADLGLPFIEPPADAILPDGFLKEEYVAEDTLHANALYGELVLQQIEETLRREPQSP